MKNMFFEEKNELVNSKLTNEIKIKIAIFTKDKTDYFAIRIFSMLSRYYSVKLIFDKCDDYRFDNIDLDNFNAVEAYLKINDFDYMIVTSENIRNDADIACIQQLIQSGVSKNCKVIYINVDSYFKVNDNNIDFYNCIEYGKKFKSTLGGNQNVSIISIPTVIGNNDMVHDNDLVAFAMNGDYEMPEYINELKVVPLWADRVIDGIRTLIRDGICDYQIAGIEISVREFVGLVRAIKNDEWNKSESNSLYEDVSAILKQKGCVFKIVYMLSPQNYFNGERIAKMRLDLGKRMSHMIPPEIANRIDMIVPVPKTGMYYAMGLAAELGKPYVHALIKESTSIRTFQIHNSNIRKEIIRKKIVPIKELLEGKSIIIVDEAIFTGTTLKEVCGMLHDCNVKEIYISIPSPACYNHCNFGMQPKRSMLLEYCRENSLKEYFDVDGVYFQDRLSFEDSLKSSSVTCMNCFEQKEL